MRQRIQRVRQQLRRTSCRTDRPARRRRGSTTTQKHEGSNGERLLRVDRRHAIERHVPMSAGLERPVRQPVRRRRSGLQAQRARIRMDRPAPQIDRRQLVAQQGEAMIEQRERQRRFSAPRFARNDGDAAVPCDSSRVEKVQVRPRSLEGEGQVRIEVGEEATAVAQVRGAGRRAFDAEARAARLNTVASWLQAARSRGSREQATEHGQEQRRRLAIAFDEERASACGQMQRTHMIRLAMPMFAQTVAAASLRLVPSTGAGVPWTRVPWAWSWST